MPVELQIGDYKAVLTRDGDSIHLDRSYKGGHASRIRHTFDNQKGDNSKVHSTDPHRVAEVVHWCCTGVAANAVELAAIRATIAPLYDEKTITPTNTRTETNQ